MRKRVLISAAAMLPLAACGGTDPAQTNAATPPAQQPAERAPLSPPTPGTAGGLPIQPGSPVAEPNGPIDPKSAEAAGQVVQLYAALVEAKKFDEAARLRPGNTGASLKQDYAGYSEVHMQIGAPSEPEGAAGSAYVTVPVVVYGRQLDGKQFSNPGTVTLRRINDVPGSTEEQRRWHIETIVLKPTQ
ncbi:hypothetical protein G7078_02595 [Sphingomonas sinipercae]|uniref:Lipoprotein n=1 Tax=Sphingomonas sinipercae TaxID=2714944 RepID=A0A6G7ZLG9_9SPHN|nr:hypothetical protein [Sphingomonas sinipercae]QIL01783.1 hypothetical protein G7078_02595 [Sphingomonas sinipercae]